MAPGTKDPPLATPAKRRPRAITGEPEPDSDGIVRDASPSASRGPACRGLAIPEDDADEQDEAPRKGTILREKKEDGQGDDQYRGALADDPDPRIRWGSRNGFTTRESFNDFRAILKLIDSWYIKPQDLQQATEIDSGSFGSIFSGSLRDKEVAIKRVSGEGTAGLSYPQIFRAMRLELSIASVLQHPNVVQFHGISALFPSDEEDDSNFQLGFVFELCNEGSLFSQIHRKKKFHGDKNSFLPKMKIACDIAGGMRYVHEQNIVHRDLSTRNILLARGMQVKIADFGCARQVVGKSYDSTTISGSPAYMSPEQLQGRELTVKVDVWALGVITWEMLNEKIPWNDRDCNNRKGLAKYVAIDGGRLPKTPASKLARDEATRSALASILEGTFQSKANQRSSMAEVHDSLVKLLSDHEVVATKIAAAEKQLEETLARFYEKHNPSKVAQVADLAKVFQGKEHVLNERLRKAYKEDLDAFENSSDCKDVSWDNSPADIAPESLDAGAPDTDDVAEQLREFFLQLNPAKMDDVPKLVQKYAGNYEDLNRELRVKYSRDLRTPIEEMKRRSVGVSLSRDSDVLKAGSAEPMAAGIGGSLPRGGSAPPMQESPEKSHTQWRDKMRPLLQYFYSQINPSKVKDVEKVLKLFANDTRGLNSTLRKTYGGDLSMAQQELQEVAAANKRQEETAKASDHKTQALNKDAPEQNTVKTAATITSQKNQGQNKNQTNGISELKEQLVRFYSAWDVSGNDVDGLASKFVAKIETLNRLLRQKYQGTDLTWTPEEISLHIAAKKDDAHVPAKAVVATQSERSWVEEKQPLLQYFYSKMNPAKLSDVPRLLNLFVGDDVALNKSLKKAYGVDLSASREEIQQKKARREKEEEERTRLSLETEHQTVAEKTKQEEKEREGSLSSQEGNKKHLAEEAEQQRLAEEKAREAKAQEEAEARRAKMLKTLEESLLTFYAAWGVTREQKEVTHLAVKYQDVQDELAQKLQEKYHGTDHTWSASQLEDKVAEIDRETKRQEELKKQAEDERMKRHRAEEAEQQRLAEEKAREAKAQEEAEARRAKMLKTLEESLLTFYAAWGITREQKEVTHLAVKYQDVQDELAQKLQEKYHGTDHTWSASQLEDKVAEIDRETKRQEELKKQAEDERMKRHRAEEAEQQRLAEEKAREAKAQEEAEARRAKMLKTLEESLLTFYAAWGVTREQKEVTHLAVKYQDVQDELAQKLQEKYHGTDHTWSASQLEDKVAEIDRETKRQEELKRVEAEAAAAAEVAEQEQEILKLANDLLKFYASWEVKRSHDEIIELATKYTDIKVDLNRKLRERYHGTDLTCSEADLASITASFRAAEQKQKEEEAAAAASEAREEVDRVDIERLSTSLRTFFAHWYSDKSEEEICDMAVKYRGDQGALRIFLQEQFFGTDHTWARAEIHVRRLESHLMRFYQQWDVERETTEIQKQVKDADGNVLMINAQLQALFATDLDSPKSEITQKKQLFDELRKELSALYRQVDPDKLASVDEIIRSHQIDRDRIYRMLQEHGLQPRPLQEEIARRLPESDWTKTVESMLVKFCSKWRGRLDFVSNLDTLSLAREYRDNIGSLNQLLRKQCHGADLTTSDAEIEARAAKAGAMQAISTMSLPALTAELQRFYASVNPQRITDAPFIAKNFIGKVPELNETLADKYDGMNLLSSSGEISTYLQKKRGFETLTIYSGPRLLPKKDTREIPHDLALSSDISPDAQLRDRLREFYLRHSPENAHRAEEVARRYHDDVNLLNRELERKYGANLVNSVPESEVSASETMQNILDLDRQMQAKVSEVTLRIEVKQAQGGDSKGADSSSSGPSPPPTAASRLAPWYCGPRDTLEERVRMFYSYWNPAQMDSSGSLVRQCLFDENLVNQALWNQYLVDLRTPEPEILRRGHLSTKLQALFHLILPANELSSSIESVPSLVQRYYGREHEMDAMLQQKYGVGLDVVALSSV